MRASAALPHTRTCVRIDLGRSPYTRLTLAIRPQPAIPNATSCISAGSHLASPGHPHRDRTKDTSAFELSAIRSARAARTRGGRPRRSPSRRRPEVAARPARRARSRTLLRLAEAPATRRAGQAAAPPANWLRPQDLVARVQKGPRERPDRRHTGARDPHDVRGGLLGHIARAGNASRTRVRRFARRDVYGSVLRLRRRQRLADAVRERMDAAWEPLDSYAVIASAGWERAGGRERPCRRGSRTWRAFFFWAGDASTPTSASPWRKGCAPSSRRGNERGGLAAGLRRGQSRALPRTFLAPRPSVPSR